jgi:hypothetical protein
VFSHPPAQRDLARVVAAQNLGFRLRREFRTFAHPPRRCSPCSPRHVQRAFAGVGEMSFSAVLREARDPSCSPSSN